MFNSIIFAVKITLTCAFCTAFLLSAYAFNSNQPMEVWRDENLGREIYNQNCAKCHGEDGRGVTDFAKTHKIPDISSARWQQRHSDKKIIKVIEKGEGEMPAFKEKLSKEEIAALVAHVRTLKK